MTYYNELHNIMDEFLSGKIDINLTISKLNELDAAEDREKLNQFIKALKITHNIKE